MRYRQILLPACLGALLFASQQAASAQTPDPKKVLVATASALGMVRGIAHSLDVVNMFEYTASGTMADSAGGQDKVSRITVGYDYVIPAIRVDLEKTVPKGEIRREVTVAAGPLAWDESTPGIFSRRSNVPAVERLRQIWIMPHAVVLEGAKAPDKVRVAERGGAIELIVPRPDGSEIRATLDAKNFPTHVEMNVGAQTYSGDFADYKDFQEYGVMFPSRISQKVDGAPVAEFAVSEALANPYLIFPPPKELKP
jgi:hypothetical protein